MAKTLWFWANVVIFTLLFGMMILDGIHKAEVGMDEGVPYGVIQIDEVNDESRRT